MTKVEYRTAITLESLERLASPVGRQLRIDLA
jgi:hypothetical protein